MVTKAKAVQPYDASNPPTNPVPPDGIPVEDQAGYDHGPVWEGAHPGDGIEVPPDRPDVDTTYWHADPKTEEPPPESPTPTPPPPPDDLTLS